MKGVKICVMDATTNDAPAAYKAKGFPSMHFFPAKANAEGVEYEGERTSKDFIDFLTKNAVNTFKFDTSQLGADPAAEEEDGEEEGGFADDGGDGHFDDEEGGEAHEDDHVGEEEHELDAAGDSADFEDVKEEL